MKARILVSVINILLAMALVSGTVWAWFADGVTLASPFTAGTVQIAEPELIDTNKCGHCIDFDWLLQSTGSKRSYFRVRPALKAGQTGDESAWLQGIPIQGDWWFGQYLAYKKGSHTQANPLRADFIQGPKLNVLGWAEIWDDGGTLYVHYQMLDGVAFTQTHFYAGLEVPKHSIPGNLPLHQGFAAAPEFNLELQRIFRTCTKSSLQNVDFAGLGDGDTVYIAAHLEGCGRPPGEISVVFFSDWIQGNDGWWYYGSHQPRAVMPEENVMARVSACSSSGLPGEVEVQLEAEAVQASHGAMDVLWPGNPWLAGSD